MKRRIETRVIAFILMLVMMITILPAKSADAKTAKRMGAPAMAEKNVTLYIKGSYATSYAIQIKNITADAKITYSSSNRKIAVVNDEGIVTPLKKGTATISARVSQGGKNYKLNMVCKVQKAKLIFAAKKAQRTTEETPVTISVGNSLKTKLRLGGKAVSIFSQNKKDNNEFYNVKAVIYDAKTGKQLTKAKNSATNKYITISENGVLTAKKKGEYYIEFTSFPQGCTNRIYVTVRMAKKETITPSPEPSATATPTPTSTPTPTTGPEVTKTPASKAEDTPKKENEGSEEAATEEYAAQLPGVEKKPTFITVTLGADEVAGYSFEIRGYREGAIESFINAADSSGVSYRTEGEKIIPEIEKGKTYTLKLAENSGALIFADGKLQEETVTTLNIITEKEEVMNLSVAEDMIYIPAGQVSEMKGQVFDGLYTANLGAENSGEVTENKYTGSFVYRGTAELKAGDKVAVYSGVRPDLRNLDSVSTKDDGAVAYVIITEKKGDTYLFKSADAEDVIAFTEVLPVPVDADTDNSSTNHSITVAAGTFDYSDSFYGELGLDENTTVDIDDYIIFYKGEPTNGETTGYAKVTGVRCNGDMVTVTYVDATMEEVNASMDMNSSRNADIELSDDEIAELEDSIRKQAYASGFIDEAAKYLTALAVETDGFKELSDDFDLDLESYDIHLADASVKGDVNEMKLMGIGVEPSIEDSDVWVNISGKLDHFKGAKGIRAELGIKFVLQFKSDKYKSGHLELEVEASFVEELVLDIDIDGGAVWKKKWIFPYIADYQATASIDWGTYTNVDISATVRTAEDDDDEDEPGQEAGADNSESGTGGNTGSGSGRNEGENGTGGNTGSDENDSPAGKFWGDSDPEEMGDNVADIGEQMLNLMSKKGFLGGMFAEDEGEGDVLSRKYASFIEDAGDSWMPIIKQKIIDLSGAIDPLHIMAFNISAYFVVRVNLYVTMGVNIETGERNRYIYNIKLKKKSVSTKVINLEKSHTRYEFYVFGTAGLKVGIEMELAVGLFSTKLDSVGIEAEAGAYAELWGYFYAMYSEQENDDGGVDVEQYRSGALYLEVGFYLGVNFKAQLFSSDKLTYNPTIYENEWPLFTLGEQQNVLDFASIYDGKEEKTLEIVGVKEISLDSDYFSMKYIDLKEGEIESAGYDDDTESRFIITLSNKKFSYDPKTNCLKVNVAGRSSDREECVMTIRWKGNDMAFTTKPVEKTINILWTDPENVRYISFDTDRGSNIPSVTGTSGSKVTVPADPVKTGYVFEGWYTEPKLINKFTFPETMPNYESRGITVYAKWSPAKDTHYTVNYYIEGLNEKYELRETVDYYGETGSTPALKSLIRAYEGADYNSAKISSVGADGKTVMSIYYKLTGMELKFTYGVFSDDRDMADICQTYKYGSKAYAPILNVPGYDFLGFAGLETDEDGSFSVLMPGVYEAVWRPSENTEYTLEYYLKNPENGAYELYETVLCYGRTGSTINVEAGKYTDDRYVFNNVTVINGGAVDPAVSQYGDTVVRYRYDRASYKITYMNGTAVFGMPEVLKWGKRIDVPFSVPVKKGYKFMGWFTDSSCSEASLFNFENVVMEASDMYLYAGWTEAEGTAYAVEYYGQNADDDGYTLIERDGSFSGKTGAVATAEYKSFEHFTEDKSAEATVNNVVISSEGDTVLKLYYNRATVNVTLKPEGGSLNGPEVLTLKYGQNFRTAVPSRDNYAFAGWYLENGEKYDSTEICEDEDFTLKAVWDADTVNYTLKHYVMDTEGNYPAEADYVISMNAEEGSEQLLQELVRSELEADGGIVCRKASTDDGSSFISVNESKASVEITNGMTIGLYYEREMYELSWEINLKQPLNEKEYSKGMVYYDADVTMPVFSEGEGYIYGFTPMVAAKMPASDMKYTLVETPIGYNLVFAKNALAVEGEGNEMESLDKLVYDRAYTLPQNKFTRTGYVFKGWSMTQNPKPGAEADFEDNDEIRNLTVEQNGTVTLYAVWESISYGVKLIDSVQWDDNLEAVCHYDDNDPEITEYVYGVGAKLPVPYCEGFDFEGWYDNSEYEGERVTLIGTADIGDREFWPKWKLHEYDVVWYANGGNFVVSETESIVKYITSETIASRQLTQPAVEPVKAPDESGEYSYEFEGWYTASEGGESLSDLKNFNPAEGVTLYAHWTAVKNSYNINWMLVGDGEISAGSDLYTVFMVNLLIIALADESVLQGYSAQGWTNDKIKKLKELCQKDEGTEEEIESLYNNYYPTGWNSMEIGKAEVISAETISENAEPVEYGTKIVPPLVVYEAASGYIVDGWYDMDECDIVESEYVNESGETCIYREVVPHADASVLTPDSVVTKNATYVLIYTPKTFEITWDTNADSDAIIVFPEEYTCKSGAEKYDTKIEFPEITRKSDPEYEYIFEGWYTSDIEGEKVTEAWLKSDITYYAHWQKIPRQYSVTFDPVVGYSSSRTFNYNYGTPLSGTDSDFRSITDYMLYISKWGECSGFVLCDSETGMPVTDADGQYQYYSELVSDEQFIIDKDMYFKADWRFYFWIFGEQACSIESAGKNYLPAGDKNKGSVMFDADTMTIILTDCEIYDGYPMAERDFVSEGSRFQFAIGATMKPIDRFDTPKINILLNGKNVIEFVGGKGSSAEKGAVIAGSEDNYLDILGDGELDLIASNDGTGRCKVIYGIYLENGIYYKVQENTVNITSGEMNGAAFVATDAYMMGGGIVQCGGM